MTARSRAISMAAIACAAFLAGCVEERYDGPDWDAPIYERDRPDYDYDPRYEPRPRYPRYEPRPDYEPRPRYPGGDHYRPRPPREEPRGEYRPRPVREEPRGEFRPRPPREEPRPSRPSEEPRPTRPGAEPRPARPQPVDCAATPNRVECAGRRTGTGGTDNPAGEIIQSTRQPRRPGG